MEFIGYQLFRELIEGNIFVSERDSGIFDLIITLDGSVIENYENITETATFYDWLHCCLRTDKDYKYTRRVIKELFGLVNDETWNNYNEDIQIIISSYKATTIERCETSLGVEFTNVMREFDSNSIECRNNRFSGCKAIIMNNLTQLSSMGVLKVIQVDKMDYNYIFFGIEGTQDNDPIEGLFNYVESTPLSTYGLEILDPYGVEFGKFETTGLSTVVLDFRTEMTQEELVNKIIFYLRYGVCS